jgi:hypothetical protein
MTGARVTGTGAVASWSGRSGSARNASLHELKKPRRVPGLFVGCAEYERQLGGGSPLSSLMTAKD